jgi:aminoglycoside phosphotransferase (APT) family kinase protein
MPSCSIMVEYKPSHEVLAAIARLHGVSGDNVRAIPSGVANHVFQLGDDLILRIPRTERSLLDLSKEAAVIPTAREAGVRTPNVVTFDDTCSEVNVPYMVLTRAPGLDLAQHALSTAETEHVLREVGRELAKLHRLSPTTAADLRAVPSDEGSTDPRTLTLRLLADGWIDADASRWLNTWIDRLATHLPPGPPPRVLVHGDIAPQNLLVSPDTATLTGIVDWGDAAWADPAIEFAKTPLTGVPAMLDGYRQELGETTSPSAGSGSWSWEARVLRVHLTWALNRLADPAPSPGARHWTAPPASRLLGLLRFFTSSPPAPWSELVRQVVS